MEFDDGVVKRQLAAEKFNSKMGGSTPLPNKNKGSLEDAFKEDSEKISQAIRERDFGRKLNLNIKSAKKNVHEDLEQQAKAALKNEIEQVVKKMTTRALMRLVGGAAAATLIGFIVTYILWTIQAFAGNLLQSQVVPELEWWELLLWLMVSFLIFASIIMVVALFYILLDKNFLTQLAWDSLKNWAAGAWEGFKNKFF